ncbi:MAG TPA: DUF3592 domain-containing protein [Desulfobulbus sp.]|nr:DUF3592 domain-containing protein [Desulfobulbus sp.]
MTQIFLLIFTVLAVVGSIKLLHNLHNADISRKWPKYSATIIESGYEKVGGGFDEGIAYRVTISYRYIVDGVQYENSNYDFCNQYVDKNEREQLLARYPVGKEITVRVNPKKPANAVIIPGVTWRHYFWIMLSFVLLYLFLKGIMSR